MFSSHFSAMVPSLLKKSVVKLGTLFLLFLLFIANTVTSTQPAHATSFAGNRVNWLGSDYFLLGANVPWFNYGRDFGGGAGNGGVLAPDVALAVDSAFQTAQSAGITNVRWWLFEGGATQILRSADGTPTGLNQAIYPDIDAAVTLARKHGLYLQFSLFSSTTDIPTTWVDNSTQRTALANVLAPLFARYKSQPQIMTWESFNEPEYQIRNNQIDQAGVQATSQAIADAAHANSSAKFVVGSATVDGMTLWSPSSDFYNPHWYQSTMSSGSACADCYADISTVRSSETLSDTKPIVIGETDLGAGFAAATTPQAMLQQLYDKGFAGVFGWSLFPSHTADRFALDMAGVTAFSATASNVGPQAAQSSGLAPCLTLSAQAVPNNVARTNIDVAVYPAGSTTLTEDIPYVASSTSSTISLGDAALVGAPIDIYVRVPGFLRRKAPSTTFSSSTCASLTVAQNLVAGDFNSDNSIALGDIITAIRAFNGGSDAQATTAKSVFGGSITLGSIVTVIRNFNTSPTGD